MQKKWLAVLTLSVLISGCGLTHRQLLKTHQFGSATEKMGALGEEEFENIRSNIIRMNSELMAIDNTKTSASLILDRPASAEATMKRVAACKALRSYGELLVKLADKNDKDNLQTVTESLTQNSALALQTELTDEQIEAIGRCAAGFGHIFIEKKKADALKKIIPAYEKPVHDLARLLMVDFSLAADMDSVGYLKALDITARRLKNASIRLVNAGAEYSVYERDRAVQAYVLAEQMLTRSESLNKKAVSSIKGLQKANSELVRIMLKDRPEADDIKKYAEEINELMNAYQVLTK
ncbi:hypothetical protein JW948_04860 [bacterium]|nr:hypothetical protein [bacterium]